MYKKYIYLSLLILGSSFFCEDIQAQMPSLVDTISVEQRNQKAKELVDKVIQNNEKVRPISFENISEKYNSEEFDYNDEERKSFLSQLFTIITKFVERFFGLTTKGNERKLLYLLYFIVFSIALFVAIRLIMQHKGRWFWEKADKDLETSLQEVEKNIHKTDFAKLIKESESQNNTRQSIRLYYLWLLKTLSDKQLIIWQSEKTNADYIREIKDEQLRNNFSRLSRLYNYIWYGEFSIEHDQYKQAKADFETHINVQKIR